MKIGSFLKSDCEQEEVIGRQDAGAQQWDYTLMESVDQSNKRANESQGDGK